MIRPKNRFRIAGLGFCRGQENFLYSKQMISIFSIEEIGSGLVEPENPVMFLSSYSHFVQQTCMRAFLPR